VKKDSSTSGDLRQQAGRLLKQWRTAAALTQMEVAKRVGVEYYSFISAIEQGKSVIPLDKFDLWADALKRDKSDFARTMLKYYHPNLAKRVIG
jgi:transcriptional regulator with XRE-family HTH domain